MLLECCITKHRRSFALKIESGIDYPAASHGSSIYTIRMMKVGDSVVLTDRKKLASFRVQTCVHMRGTDKKFSSKKTGENEWRVWRLA
jgi:hypothetical protein